MNTEAETVLRGQSMTDECLKSEYARWVKVAGKRREESREMMKASEEAAKSSTEAYRRADELGEEILRRAAEAVVAYPDHHKM